MKTIGWFIAISSANHFTFMGARLAVVLYAAQLQASPAAVGLLVALFGLVSTVFSVPAGRLMDRVGVAGPMLWFSAIMVAGCALGWGWRDLGALFIVSPVVGTFYSLFYVGHTQWLGRIGASQQRSTNYSLAALGFAAATFLAPIAIGFVVERAGHPEAFLMLAAAPLFTIAVLALRVIEAPAPPAHPTGPRGGGRRGGVFELARDRKLLPVYAVCVIASATWSIASLMIPLYGVEIGLSASGIGLVLGAYSLASVVIRVVMIWLGRRFTDWQLMIASFALAAACILVFPLFAGIGALMTVGFLLGLGIGLAGPLSQALLYEAAPAGRVGEVMGLRVTAMNATSTVVPLAAGAASGLVGVAPVFGVMAAFLAGGSWWVRGKWNKGK
ncbi:MAG: MFS transporter [Burkholderiales bacterium]|nr:MFS transporter [Burkholderiales bacterium]